MEFNFLKGIFLLIALTLSQSFFTPKSFKRGNGGISMNIVDLKKELMFIAAKSNRGSLTHDNDKASDIIAQLESFNPSFEEPNNFSLMGEWELVYSDAELFQGSPFFLILREILGKRENAKNAFKLHRAATAGGEIKNVRQIISASQMISKVDLGVGILPGIPFSIQGCVVSKAELEFIDTFTLSVKLLSTSIENSNLPFVASIVEQVNLPVGDVVKMFRAGDAPKAVLSTYYLDGDLRITRNEDDNVFVYVRT